MDTLTLPEELTEKDLEKYVRYNGLLLKYKPLRDALNNKIKLAFDKAGLKKGTYLFKTFIIKRGEQNCFDAEAFKKAHPFEKYPQYYRQVPTFDATLVPDTEKPKKFFEVRQTLSITSAVPMEIDSDEVQASPATGEVAA